MRKFLFATVALTGVLVATSAQAKDWFAIDHVNARCEQGLGKDPVEVQNYVRSQSFVPHVTVTRDDNNLVRHVKISWRGVNQEDSVVDMFSDPRAVSATGPYPGCID
jgi:2'-5' RNA ligase